MIALFLAPIYFLVNGYIVHRLYGFLEGCHPKFNLKIIKGIIAFIYILPAISPVLAVLMPHGTVSKRFFQFLCNYWFAVIIYTAIIVFIGHLISLFLRRIIKVLPRDYFQKRSRKVFYGVITLLIIFGITSYGIYNAHNIKEKDYSITVNKTVEGTDSLKVVLLADLHLGYSIGVNHIEEMVNLVNQQNPDIVCIAGDIFDNDYDALDNPDRLAELFRSMKSTYGTYACWGNHDVNERVLAGFTFGAEDEKKHDKRMVEFLEKSNIKLLEDETTLIDNKFYVTGRVDGEKPATVDNERKSPQELLGTLDKSKPIIVLYHEPNELQELSDAGADVVLSGHTHNGQIFPGTVLTKIMWENPCGYVQKGDMHSIVTSGVGIFGPFMRVGTDAEICTVNVNFK